MLDFQTEKDKLLLELDDVIKRNSDQTLNKETLKFLYQNLELYQSVSCLNGVLSRIVVDNLSFDLKIGEKLIEFENHFSNSSD